MKRYGLVVLLFFLAAVTTGVIWLAQPEDNSEDRKSEIANIEQKQVLALALARNLAASSATRPAVVAEAPPEVMSIQHAPPIAHTPPTPPEGYSFTTSHGNMQRASSSGYLHSLKSPKDDPKQAWLTSPDAISLLVDQSKAAKRAWTFGYLRMTQGTSHKDVVARLAALHVVVLGTSGELIRSQLPGSTANLQSILALPQIDGLGAVPLEQKIPAAFLQEAQHKPAGEQTPVFITLMTDDPDAVWYAELEALGVVVGDFHADIRTYEANLSFGILQRVAAADFVLAIEPVGVVKATHDTSVPTMGADAIRFYEASTGLFSGTGGASVPIGVMDTGLNTKHMDISANRNSICGVNFITDNLFQSPTQIDEQYDLWFDRHGHGSHVVGSIVGNGRSLPQYSGVAPNVQHIRFAKVLSMNGIGSNYSVIDGMDFMSQASNCNSGSVESPPIKPLIVNMSLSASAKYFQGRTIAERKLDSIVWNHRQLYVVAQSNKNEIAFSNYAAAKSSLAVGAAGDGGNIASFSSHGPTADGRLAPQVVAAGVAINSTQGAGSRTDYVTKQGTSMSAPAVSGVAALLYDAVPDAQNTPAIARALLMATAIKPDPLMESATQFAQNNTAGPGHWQNQYGLGKVSARAAVLNQDTPTGWASNFAVTTLVDDEPYQYVDIVVPENASRIDIVVTWDEPPADTIRGSVLNDIDLWVDHGTDCALTDAKCGEYSSHSRVDNVEWVIIRNPDPGIYRAKLVADQIYSDNRAAIAWQVIRGTTKPQLTVTADKSEVQVGKNQAFEVNLSVTANEYIAAGVTLQLACRKPGENPDCTDMAARSLIQSASTVTREDNLSRPVENNPFRTPIALGEIAGGEDQSLTLTFRNQSWYPSHRLYFIATSWNALADSTSLAVNLYEAQIVNDVPAEVVPLAQSNFKDAVEISQTEGNLAFDLLLAGREPGEPVLPRDEANGALNVTRSLWFKWVIPETANSRYWITVENADSVGTDVAPVHWDFFLGDDIASLVNIFSITDTGVYYNGKSKAGDTYYIRLSMVDAVTVPRVLRWVSRNTAPPPNDSFGTSAIIEGVSGTITGDNSGATLEAGEDMGGLAATAWYKWRAPANRHWQFRVKPTSVDADLWVLVFEGESLASLRLVSGNPNWNSYPYSGKAAFLASAGTEYRIAVVATNAEESNSSGTYELEWVPYEEDRTYLIASSTHDHFSGAKELFGLQSNYYVSAAGYWTVEPGEPMETGTRTRWFSWVPSSSGEYTWRLYYTPHKISFFSELSLDDLTLITQSDPQLRSRSEIKVTVQKGKRYWIALGLDGQYAYRTNLTGGWLYWGGTPINDNVSGAVMVEGINGSVSAATLFATLEPGEPSNTAGHQSLWWKWAAPADGWQRFWLAAGSTETGVLSLYKQGPGGGFNDIELVATSEMTFALNGKAELIFNAEAGQQYMLRLATRGDKFSVDDTFTVQWESSVEPIWLRYIGRVADGDAVLVEKGIDLRSPGSMAFNSAGTVLHVAAQYGLAVFSLNDDSAMPVPQQFVWNGEQGTEDSVSLYVNERTPILWDTTRSKLYASDAYFGRLHQFVPNSENAGVVFKGLVPSLEGVQPEEYLDHLIIDGAGKFISTLKTISYFDLDLYSALNTFAINTMGQISFVESHFYLVSSEATTYESYVAELKGLRQAVIAVDGSYLYAVTRGSLLTFSRDVEAGTSELVANTPFYTIDDLLWLTEASSLALTPDGATLAVTGKTDAHVALFDLADDPGMPEYITAVTGFAANPDSYATYVKNEIPKGCLAGLTRSDSRSVDVFCEDAMFSVVWDQETESLYATDYLARWQADRFGNEVPAFGKVRSAVASPDSQHVYLTGDEDDHILVFERIGGNAASDN